MCGTHDPTAPASVAPANGGDANARGGVARLLGLPLFAAVTATFCNAYTAVRNSHESVATVLGYAEDGMRASVELASPVTGRISGALETPLKAVDDAVRVGLDYVEEKIPSVKLPPGQIYANAWDSVRNIFISALETIGLLFGTPKNQIEDSSAASENAQREVRKVSS